MLCLKIGGWVANSVDPDETPHLPLIHHSVASHQGLHYLPLIHQFLDTPLGSKLFAQACLSEYICYIQYFKEN